MAEKFEADIFDALPTHSGRVGAHRAPVKPFRGLKRLGIALAATVLLSGIGIGSIIAVNNNLFNPADVIPIASPTPTIEPMLDPSVPVTILNGTPTAELATQAADTLTAAGLTVEATANADTNSIAESAVYFVEPGQEAAARGVAQELGINVVNQTDGYALFSPITVVLGADFVPQVLGG